MDRAASGANAPTLAAFRNGLYALSFSANTMQQTWFALQLPHSWAQTDVRMHIHWSPGNSTNTGVVRWGLEYSWANIAEAFAASQTIYIEQAASGIAYDHQLAAWIQIPASNKLLSSILLCRVFRDAAHANDTFNAVAFGLSVDAHIHLARMGGPTETGGAV